MLPCPKCPQEKCIIKEKEKEKEKDPQTPTSFNNIEMFQKNVDSMLIIPIHQYKVCAS
jgi:hypothetical protein